MSPKKILVLGGTGFVGSRVLDLMLHRGWAAVSLSRRGAPKEPLPDVSDRVVSEVDWRAGDASTPGVVEKIVRESGPFDAVVHAVGALFDSTSGLGRFNRYVSGSGSVPSEGASYDGITRQTALSLLAACKEPHVARGTPFVFVSAAEAGWPEMAGGQTIERFAPDWLKRYLTAKRSVEAALLAQDRVRPVVLRPSLVWNWQKWDMLVPVALFSAASAIGVPFVKRPIRIEDLAEAAAVAAESGVDDGAKPRGMLFYEEMQDLLRSAGKR